MDTLMSSKILDGKFLAGRIKDQLRQEVEQLKKSTGSVPHVVNLMIGGDPSACAYANSQKKVAESIGIRYDLIQLKQDQPQTDVEKYIEKFNRDDAVHGIMIHKPVPDHI